MTTELCSRCQKEPARWLFSAGMDAGTVLLCDRCLQENRDNPLAAQGVAEPYTPEEDSMREGELFDRDMWGIPIPRRGTRCTWPGCNSAATWFYSIPDHPCMWPRCAEHAASPLDPDGEGPDAPGVIVTEAQYRPGEPLEDDTP